MPLPHPAMLPFSGLVHFDLPETDGISLAIQDTISSDGEDITPSDSQDTGPPCGHTHVTLAPSPALEKQPNVNEDPHDNNGLQGWGPNSPESRAVFRLPPEVLGCIFRIIFDAHLEALDTRRTKLIHDCKHSGYLPDKLPKLPRPPWIVLLVCRQWRAAAMSYAGLWTRIYDMDPGRLKQFASFSSRLSLDFEIRLIGTPHDSQIAALSDRYSDRVRSLSLLAPRGFPMYYVSEFLRNFLGHRASRLRSLDLTLLGPHRAEVPYEPLFLGDSRLFAGRVSHLQALSVYCPSGALILQMDCPVFRTLQYLCVASNTSWQTSPTTHFMSCLQTWTELRELHLYFGLPSDLTNMPHNRSSFLPPFKYKSYITLPSIRKLYLVDHVRVISNFMARVSLHPSTVLNFEFMVFDQRIFPETNNTRWLAAINLVAQVSELAGAPPVHLELLCGGSGGTFSTPRSPTGRVRVAWSTVPIPDDDDDDDNDGEGPVPQFTLIFQSWGCVITQIASLGFALDTLELSHVRTLALDATEPHYMVHWLRAFTKLQNLRDLRIVEAQRAGRFFKALGTPASRGRAYLPNLVFMYISVRSMRQSTFDALMQALKNRMDLGSRLPILRIVMDQNEPLNADREKALAQVVGSVESETADLDFKEEEDEDKEDAGSEANVDGGHGMAEEDEVRTEDAGTQGDDSN